VNEPAGVTYLTLEDVLSLVRALAVGPIRDLGLLDSAVARPSSNLYGQEAYPKLSHKVAALLHSLTNNHALADGNTRLAWLAAVVFLDLNGVECTLTDEDAFTLVWDVAAGHLDVATTADRLATAEMK
jgi:death on curing protein